MIIPYSIYFDKISKKYLFSKDIKKNKKKSLISFILFLFFFCSLVCMNWTKCKIIKRKLLKHIQHKECWLEFMEIIFRNNQQVSTKLRKWFNTEVMKSETSHEWHLVSLPQKIIYNRLKNQKRLWKKLELMLKPLKS